MMYWTELFLFATALLLLVLWTRRPKNFPPGPFSVPLLGSLPAMSRIDGHPHDVLWTLGKRHGPVTGIFLGPQPVVVVTGYRAVKNVLGRDDLAYRQDLIPVQQHFFKKRLGVFFTDGPMWKEQRRFTLRHLRDFGFGRQTMDALIQEEADVLLKAVEAEVRATPEQLETGVDILPILPVLAINILWIIIAGERFELSDKRFLRLTQAVVKLFRGGKATSPVTFFPVLQKIPIVNAAYKHQITAVREIQDFVENTIEEHFKTYDGNHMRDFIDVYIKELKAQNNANSSFTKEQLTAVCIDLFNAGTETTASTLGYCLRYMVQRPDVQDKLRAEVLRVVGSERLPSMNDMPNLPYAQAVVNEVLRHSGLAPFPPPHFTRSDTEILGHKVPKNTLLIVNLWSVHMDPEIWGDPEEFRPERFIAEDGTLVKNEHLMLFGQGPRVCLGEPLARSSTFLFFTSLIQRFQFHVPSLGPPPSNEQLQGFTTSPAPFRMAITRVN